MGIFSNVFNIFGGIAKSLSKAHDFLEENKILETLSKGTDLLQYALPVVKAFAALTPTSLDNAAIAIIERYGIPASKLFQEGATGLDKIIQDGGRQKVVIELLRKQLIDIIMAGGNVHLGEKIVDTVEEVLELSDNSLAVAVEQALALLKSSKPVEAPAPAPAKKYVTVEEIKARIGELRAKLDKASDPSLRASIEARIASKEKDLAEAEKARDLSKPSPDPFRQ